MLHPTTGKLHLRTPLRARVVDQEDLELHVIPSYSQEAVSEAVLGFPKPWGDTLLLVQERPDTIGITFKVLKHLVKFGKNIYNPYFKYFLITETLHTCWASTSSRAPSRLCLTPDGGHSSSTPPPSAARPKFLGCCSFGGSCLTLDTDVVQPNPGLESVEPAVTFLESSWGGRRRQC